MFRILFHSPEIPGNTGNAIRLAAITGMEPMMRATFITRTGESSYTTAQPWDTVAPRLVHGQQPPERLARVGGDGDGLVRGRRGARGGVERVRLRHGAPAGDRLSARHGRGCAHLDVLTPA